MTLLLSYQHHSKMCVTMTKRISEEDTGTLVVVTSDQNVTMSNKVMQMFSPLPRGLVTETSCVWGLGKKDPMTLILPDFSSKIVIHLMNVLLYGELVVGEEDKEEVKLEVSSLAGNLGIRLNLDNNSSLDNEISDDTCQGKNRVKKLEDTLQTSIKPDPGTYQENKSMTEVKGEYFEESLKKEMKEEVSLGYNAHGIKKVHDHVQMSDAGKYGTGDLPLKDSSSTSPGRCPKKDIIYDEDKTTEDETFREDKSEHEESEDESEEDTDASKDEDDTDDTTEDETFREDKSEHEESEDEYFRVLRRRRKPMPGPGSQTMTPSPSCSTVRSKSRSWIGHYTYDRVTKKYSCRTCHKSYGHHSHMCQHIKTAHEGVRYPCASCGKIYMKPGGLRQHIKVAHEGVKHTCASCGKTFSQAKSLQEHIKVAHEGFRYPCKICGKKYKGKHGLQYHINQHTG